MSDLISRSALIEEFEKHCVEESPRNSIGGIVTHTVESCIKIVKAQPTVEAKPVHGEWIHDINNLYGCSVCCNRETMSNKKKKNFCSNCGADMRGGKNE